MKITKQFFDIQACAHKDPARSIYGVLVSLGELRATDGAIAVIVPTEDIVDRALIRIRTDRSWKVDEVCDVDLDACDDWDESSTLGAGWRERALITSTGRPIVVSSRIDLDYPSIEDAIGLGTGEPVSTIGLDPALLARAKKALDSRSIRIEFSGPMSVVIVTCDVENKGRAYVMPMRISE